MRDGGMEKGTQNRKKQRKGGEKGLFSLEVHCVSIIIAIVLLFE